MANPGEFDSDAMLVFMDEMAKRADKLRVAVSGMGEAGTKHMRSAGEATAALDKGLLAVSRNLLGPIGVAAGFAAVARSLSDMAVGRVQLELVAQNARLSAQNVLTFRGAMERAGATTAQAQQTLGNLTTALNDVASHRWGSEIYKAISNMPNGKPWADAILADVQRGDMKQAIQDVVDLFQKSSAEARFVLGQIFNVDPALITQFSKLMDEVKRKVVLSPEESAKYLKDWADFWDEWYNIVDRVGAKLFAKLSEFRKATEEANKLREELGAKEGVQEGIRRVMKEQGVEDPSERGLADPHQMLRAQRSLTWREQLFGIGKTSLAPNESFPAPMARPEAAGLGFKDLVDTEQDSNRTLKDIRDILQGNRPTGSGFGGGQYGGTNAPGGGGAGGSVGMGGVSPRLMEAVRASAEMNLPEGYSYKFISGMRPGDPGFHGRGGAADIQIYDEKGNAIPNVGNHPGRGVYDAVGRGAEAYYARKFPGYGYTYGGHFNSGVPNDLMHHQEGGISARHFTPAELQAEIERQNKLDAAGRQRRNVERTSSTVRGSMFDDARTASGMPRDVPGVALPSREHLGKMIKVTTPDGRSFVVPQTDVGPAPWTGRGIDINRPLANMMGYGRNFPTDSPFTYEAFQGTVDKQMGAKSSWEGAASIEVDFKNVPNGVRTGMDAEGFKTLKVQRSPQAARSGGSNADYSTWAYD